jgi:hypothetical protein
MKLLIKFVLLTALRDKLYLGLLVILGGVLGLSKAVGFSALSEESQMQLVYFSSLSRIVIVCGMILFICFYLNRSFENKEVEFILSRNISRNTFVLAHWISFILNSLILIVPVSIIILFFGRTNLLGISWWSITIILELMLVSTFAITASLILKNAVIAVLSTISFYFISRMMGFFVYSISISPEFSLKSILKFLSSIFPRLDLFGKSEWLVYNAINLQDIYIVLLQSLIYIPLMLFISFHDFNKKQF